MFKRTRMAWLIVIVITALSVDTFAQKKTKKKPAAGTQSELTKLREEYINATKDYRTSLEKLLAIYAANVTKAEEKLDVARKLLAEGLIAKTQVEENERAVTA